MKRALVLTHVDFEGPGRIATLLASRGYATEVRRLHRGDRIPERMPAREPLVIMGGPMGIGDVGSPSHPYLERELDLLARCIDDDSPVLGICLGAQLLAHAAGAPVDPMFGPEGRHVYEVGWGTVRYERQFESDPILQGVPDEAYVLHWHGDTFALPTDARRLASTEACANQGFRLGRRLFGLQFHCEIDPEGVDALLRADRAFAERALGPEADARIRRDTELHEAESRRHGDRLLANILDAMEA